MNNNAKHIKKIIIALTNPLGLNGGRFTSNDDQLNALSNYLAKQIDLGNIKKEGE